MASVLWDIQGMIKKDYYKHGKTVTGNSYITDDSVSHATTPTHPPSPSLSKKGSLIQYAYAHISSFRTQPPTMYM